MIFRASDINPHAASCTRKTSIENGTSVEVTVDNMVIRFHQSSGFGKLFEYRYQKKQHCLKN